MKPPPPESGATSPAPPRTHWLDLAIVLLGGGLLRFLHVHAGLPYRIGFDEPVIAERAIAIMRSGSFNPHFFDYPGLYIYLQVLVGSVEFLAGAMTGAWRSLDAFFPEHLFAWTRAVNAAFGTATIYLLYRAALRWGRWTALLAAGLLAMWGNHVRESHFALTDVPLTLLTTSILLLSLRARESGRVGWFLAAGASVGLATATKYNGSVALLLPVIAAAGLPAPKASRVRLALGAAVAALIAFLLGAPYTLLDLPHFLNRFAEMASGRYAPRPLAEGLEIYAGHLGASTGAAGPLVVVAGVLWGTVRALRERAAARWAILLVFPLVYLHGIATKQTAFGRYLLPIVPFLCLLMAIPLVDAVAWAFSGREASVSLVRRSVQGATVAAAVAIVWPLAVVGVGWTRAYGRPTTQDSAYQAILQFIPTGAGVAVEHAVLRLPDTRYRAMVVESFAEQSFEDYRVAGVTYVVASSDMYGEVLATPNRNPEAAAAYRRLFDDPRRCLPAFRSTPKREGPEIRICRLPE